MRGMDRAAAPEDFEHRYQSVDGLRLHHVVGGRPDGETLLLLAGYPQSWYAWRRMMPLLGAEYRVLAVDLPGQGDSDKPLDGYDTATVAARVHGLVEALGIGRHGVVAHDVGAWVGFPYAAQYGADVRGLVLMDAGIPGVTLPDSLPTAPERAWRTWHFPFHAVPDLPELLIAGRERVYLDWFLRRKAADPFAFSEADLDEYERVFSLPGALRAGLGFYRAVAQSAAQNRALPELAVPVLALSADQGSIPDMAAPLRPFVRELSGACVERCGHFLPEEQPAEVAARVLAFFRAFRGSG